MNWTEAIRRLNVSEWLFWNCPLSLLVHWAMIKSPMIDNYQKCVMRAFELIQLPHYWRSYAIDTYTEQVTRQNCHRERKIDLAPTRIISFKFPSQKVQFHFRNFITVCYVFFYFAKRQKISLKKFKYHRRNVFRAIQVWTSRERFFWLSINLKCKSEIELSLSQCIHSTPFLRQILIKNRNFLLPIYCIYIFFFSNHI